jgi:hypothetical protein
MSHDTTYIMMPGTDVARVLLRAGRWDQALAALPGLSASADAELAWRAQILADRFWWQLGDPAEAEAAADALAATEPVLARFCAGQLAYARVVHGIGARAGDAELARSGFAAAAASAELDGWGAFWLGVLADHIDHAPDQARAAYATALDWAREHTDWMLDSYAVRHLGDHALTGGDPAGLDLLRRSYHLRAALGARPQTAAAALTLADALPPGSEADQLRAAAEITARELSLTWLLAAF